MDNVLNKEEALEYVESQAEHVFNTIEPELYECMDDYVYHRKLSNIDNIHGYIRTCVIRNEYINFIHVLTIKSMIIRDKNVGNCD